MEDQQSTKIIQDQNLEVHENLEVVENLEEFPEPKVGMWFDSDVDALEYYHNYGKRYGFGAKIKSSKATDGVKTWVSIGCYKARKFKSTASNPLKPPPTQRVDCKAGINISLKGEKWKLNSMNMEHNHEMDFNAARYLKHNRTIPPHTQYRHELNRETGININKSVSSCQREAGGAQNFTWLEKDAENHLDEIRCHQLKGGDAQTMLQYFIKQQKENHNFFWAIDVDEENRLTKVFWADARSREACKYFGDVVTFDTTYLVNRFDMPFAPFVGINHHGQSILLGCGLVTREDTDSFVWLFQSWLSCMSDRPPNAIITDQCRAMQNAISQVFPNTRHRWCLWHIMKKLPEKFKGKEYDPMKCRLKSAVYDSLSPEDFEENWANLINKYNLQDNDWLSGLYNEKRRWVPAFVKDTFWAGMSTTQRSESMKSFFDNYVKVKTTLHEFIVQYEHALRKKVEKEEEADAHSMNSVIPMVSPYGFEKQFHQALTNEKFSQFREQHAALTGCDLVMVKVVHGVSHYFIDQDVKVVDKDGKEFRKTMKFIVQFNEESKETTCNCQLFESKGMVCTHMIVVWTKKKLTEVPKTYILERWRKDVMRTHTKMRVSYIVSKQKPEWVRYDSLLKIFNEAADKVIFSKAKTNRLTTILKGVVEESDGWDDKCHDNTCMSSIHVQNVAAVNDQSKVSKRGAMTKRKRFVFEQKSKNKAASNKTVQCSDCHANNIQDVVLDVGSMIVTQESANFGESHRPNEDGGMCFYELPKMATESSEAEDDGKLVGVSKNLVVDDDLREMSKSAAWSVSSWKPGNGVQSLWDDNIETYWQSDGAQPHLVNIQFQKKVKLQLIVLYVDFKLDESYTPSKISICAGDGFHNLKEIKTVELVKPTGWVHISLSGNDPRETFVNTFLLQIAVLSNHLNGKDTHVRQLKVYGPPPNPIPHQPLQFTSTECIMYSMVR
ncbi:Anaphase-promoting complex subunit 10 [Dionaea muscipula]